MVTSSLKKQLLLGFVALIGVGAVQGCGDDDDSVTYVPNAGSGGKAAGGASGAGTAGKAGSTPSDAGAPNDAAGSSGEGPSDAGAAGSAGAAGEAGSESGGTGGIAGSGGSTAGTGGTGGSTAGTGGTGGTGGTAGASTAFTLQTVTTLGGQVIGAANGRTLYVFKPDTPGAGNTAPVSACTGGCISTWPIYYATPVTVPAGLTASDFGSFDRGAGVLQSTYQGWPLYYYGGDSAAGTANGNGIQSNWYATKLPFVAPK